MSKQPRQGTLAAAWENYRRALYTGEMARIAPAVYVLMTHPKVIFPVMVISAVVIIATVAAVVVLIR